MKGFYLGAGVFALATLLLQGPIRAEALDLPMNGLQATAVGYLFGLLTIMVSGLYSFWRNHPFNVGELPEWLLIEQLPLKRHSVRGENKESKSRESAITVSKASLDDVTFEPSLEELPIPANVGNSRKAGTSVLQSLNKKIPKLPKPRIFDLPEEFPCPYVCEAERAVNDAEEK